MVKYDKCRYGFIKSECFYFQRGFRKGECVKDIQSVNLNLIQTLPINTIQLSQWNNLVPTLTPANLENNHINNASLDQLITIYKLGSEMSNGNQPLSNDFNFMSKLLQVYKVTSVTTSCHEIIMNYKKNTGASNYNAFDVLLMLTSEYLKHSLEKTTVSDAQKLAINLAVDAGKNFISILIKSNLK